MSKVLVVYYSRSGNTEAMAKIIAEAMDNENVDVECKKVQDTSVDELLDADGVVVGSPTYYGTMAAEIKKFLDESIKHHGKLDGKVGAAFSSAHVTGHETTVISILEALLIHGMVIQGDPQGYHYGATSLLKPDEEETNGCRRFGKRVAALIKRVTE
ncbi:MAG: NAD(P)H-dependent oxidoreductase [Spirochaetota bacterium]|nr:MAG: NAD(P)H-dependent oxidoreductase [Spirochaetota bacterium]